MTFMFEPPLRLAGTPMIDLKLARLAHDPKYQDGPADVIGYAALLPEVNR